MFNDDHSFVSSKFLHGVQADFSKALLITVEIILVAPRRQKILNIKKSRNHRLRKVKMLYVITPWWKRNFNSGSQRSNHGYLPSFSIGLSSLFLEGGGVAYIR
jgi:hypothetical protein